MRWLNKISKFMISTPILMMIVPLFAIIFLVSGILHVCMMILHWLDVFLPTETREVHEN